MSALHTPIRPPRDGMIGEQTYAAKWHERWDGCSTEPDRDEESLANIVNGRLTLRRGRVAASFVTWLGTNCGHSLLYGARRRRDKGIPNALLIEWTIENLRRNWVNCGVRLIESILAPSPGSVPAVTMDDLETVECVILWLESEAGRAFVESCEAEIDRARTASLRPPVAA